MTSVRTALTTILAAGPHGGHGSGVGAWWPIFPILWFLFWITIIVIAVVLWRRHRSELPTRSALSVLAEEFARGTITEEEYEQRRSVLRRSTGGR